MCDVGDVGGHSVNNLRIIGDFRIWLIGIILAVLS